MKEIVKSKFIADITETKLSKKEMSEKYELPQSEIGKLAKKFGVTFSKKRHASYIIVEDTATPETLSSSPVIADELGPRSEQPQQAN